MRGRNPVFIHYVHDMARARRFYESVFGVLPTFTSPGWTTLNFGSFELALHILSPGHNDDLPMPNAGLCEGAWNPYPVLVCAQIGASVE